MRSYRHWLLWFAGLGCVLALAASVTQQSAKAQAMGEGGNYGLTTFGGGPLQLQLGIPGNADATTNPPGIYFIDSPTSGIEWDRNFGTANLRYAGVNVLTWTTSSVSIAPPLLLGFTRIESAATGMIDINTGLRVDASSINSFGLVRIINTNTNRNASVTFEEFNESYTTSATLGSDECHKHVTQTAASGHIDWTLPTGADTGCCFTAIDSGGTGGIGFIAPAGETIRVGSIVSSTNRKVSYSTSSEGSQITVCKERAGAWYGPTPTGPGTFIGS